ncbi:hypothetical protein KFE96_07085 [Kordiimonas sp. SCSIO 12603]|uniref:hypothetical protein n=1 Tax=Kordiimonas sp. SCSIO 12603 TaxID=2829596 RepID=UPI0021072782|nr:hypothetical protein [Kordiimonas sp. SCSIO 12603]UTW60067.1 hypothetical protein KFE96_07085 [Kordiimonas sp. SCSIO 12603]
MVRMFIGALAVAFISFGASAQEDVDNYKGTGVQPPEEITLQQGPLVGDVRLPAGTKVNTDKTVLTGSGVNSYGRILASTKGSSSKVVRFFLDNMPSVGWNLISELQDEDIMLVYTKPNRVVVIMIERGSRATDIRITMTPRS